MAHEERGKNVAVENDDFEEVNISLRQSLIKDR